VSVTVSSGDWWVEEVPDPLETAYAFAYRVLRRAVLKGTLPGGKRVLQAELADRLAVSTTPVREALHRLASEGLIDIIPGRGAVVHTLSSDEWHEIVLMRRLLEPCALRLAAHQIDNRTLAIMERIHETMTMERDIAVWVDLNRQFHGVYYKAAGPPRLSTVLENLQDVATTYLAQALREEPALSDRANKEHGAILRGLRDRDEDALEQVILTHVQWGLRRSVESPPWMSYAGDAAST